MQKNTAVAYARFSSDQQRVESNITQLALIRKYCEEKGLNLVHEYADEAQSGTTDKRLSFQQLMTDAQAGLFNIVVVYKLDRFSRSIADHFHYRDLLEKCDVKLLSVIEQYDEETPEGEFFAHIQMGMSQFYVKNLRREVMRGHMETARQCKTNGGPPPLGYAVDPKTKRYIIDPEKSATVRLIFSLFLAGYSYIDMAKTLNEQGHTTGRGRPFPAFFLDILTNRKYIGEFSYNRTARKTKAGKRYHRRNKDESEIIRIPGGIEPIIDKADFERANQMLRERKLNRNISKKYLLSGLIRCANPECGFPMTGSMRYGGRNYVPVFTYRCNSRRRKLATCSTKELTMAKLDSYVVSYLRANVLRRGNFGATAKRLNVMIAEINAGRTETTQAEIVKLNDSIDNLEQAMANTSGGTREVMVREIQRLTEERQTLQQRAYVEEQAGKIASVTAGELRETVSKYAEMLDSGEMPKVREAVRTFVSVIRADNDTITIRVRLNAFIPGRCAQEVAYEVAGDRDTIILGKPRKSKS